MAYHIHNKSAMSFIFKNYNGVLYVTAEMTLAVHKKELFFFQIAYHKQARVAQNNIEM